MKQAALTSRNNLTLVSIPFILNVVKIFYTRKTKDYTFQHYFMKLELKFRSSRGEIKTAIKLLHWL